MAGLAALALSACTAGTLQSATPIPVDAARTASLVSSFRSQNGLGPVVVDSRLMQAAAAHALAMGGRDNISHRIGGSLGARVTNAGYEWGAAAENLGAGYASLDAAMDAWRRSASHRGNLLNPQVTGIGVAAVATPPGSRHRSYWTLILAGPRPEPVRTGPFGIGPAP